MKSWLVSVWVSCSVPTHSAGRLRNRDWRWVA